MASQDIETLVQQLARLPGLGPRSARRAVLHLMKKRESVFAPLLAAMQGVAERLVTAMENRRNVVYAPWFWRVIMGIIQHLPEALFKRLKL